MHNEENINYRSEIEIDELEENEHKLSNKQDFIGYICQLNYSNYIERLGQHFIQHLKSLYSKPQKDNLFILELGCRGAENVSNLLKLKIFDKNSFYYCGLDNNKEFIKYAVSNIKKYENQIYAKIEELHIPLEELNWSECNPDLLLINNISNYTYHIPNLLSELLKSDYNKIIVLNENPLSDISYLRNRFGSNRNARSYNELCNSLRKERILLEKEHFDSEINFPNYNEALWTALYKLDVDKECSVYSKYIEAKALLEYIVHKPLEFLLKERLLKAYLDKVRIFLKKQNNKIISRNTLFIIN